MIFLKLLFFGLFFPTILQRTLSSNETKKCVLPSGCRFGSFHYLANYFANEFISSWDQRGFICDANNDPVSYRFDLDTWKAGDYVQVCYAESFANSLEFRFHPHKQLVLEKHLNLQGAVDFLLLFGSTFNLQLTNLRGYSVDLDLRVNLSIVNSAYGNQRYVNFIRNRVEFYTISGDLVRSCRDLIGSKRVKSIFQLTPSNQYPELLFLRCEFR